MGNSIERTLEAYKNKKFYRAELSPEFPYGAVIGFDTELTAWKVIPVKDEEEANQKAMENFETDKFIIVWSKYPHRGTFMSPR